MKQESLKFGEKMAYTVGSLHNWVIVIIGTWLMYTYAPPDKPALIKVGILGLILGFGRVIDAVTDPAIAYLSDKSESRFGRRRVFIMWGLPFMALFFFLIFAPPIAHQHYGNIIYLIITLSLFWLFYTVVFIPYSSLLPEISTTKEERMSISVWVTFFMIISNIIAVMGSSYLIGKYSPKVMAFYFAIATLIVMSITPIFVREKVKVTKEYQELNIFGAISKTLKNTQFLIYAISLFIFWLGWYIMGNGMPYIVKVLLKKDETAVGTLMVVAIISALVFLPLIRWLALKIGKKLVFSIALFVATVVFPAVYFLEYLPPSFPVMKLAYAILVLFGFPFGCVFALQQAIIAEIIDYDEKLTGLRREGMYYGVFGIIYKSGTSLSFLVNGFLYSAFGYSMENNLGIRLLGPVAGVFAFIGFLVFQFYSLEEMKEKSH